MRITASCKACCDSSAISGGAVSGACGIVTCGCDVDPLVDAAGTVEDGDVPAGHVRQALRDIKRVDLHPAAAIDRPDGFLVMLQPTATVAHHHAEALAVCLGQRVEEAHRHIRREIYDKARKSGAEKSLEKPIGDLNLSVRARKALALLNVQTIGDLAARTEAELMGVKNFGTTSLDEVKERLQAFGLGLRELTF